MTTLMKTLNVTMGDGKPDRIARIYFNGDYYLEDGNNLFLGRKGGDGDWYVYTRNGYEEGVEEINARIKDNARTQFDHAFSAAWQEYCVLVAESVR